jgi:tetratricopeptide (TPR) repeat protein
MLENARRERPANTRRMEKMLVRACKKTPGPSSCEALAEHYLRGHKFDKARRAVEDGLRKYPESQKLRLLDQRIKRTDLYADFVKASQEISLNPSPDAYANLSALYRAVNDIDKALDTCAAGLAAFPTSVRLYLNVAELRLRRFAKNFMPKDAVMALANLEKAVSLDENNYAASILLAEFYLAIGATDQAAGILKKILISNPADEHAQKLLESALEVSARGEPVEDLLREVSESKQMKAKPELLCYLEKCTRSESPAPPRNVDPEKMKQLLAEALPATGARAMVILDHGGEIAAAARLEGDPISIDAFAEAAKDIVLNTNDYALRMDLGGFENGEIEGPFGHLLVNSIEGWLIAGITRAKPSNREKMRKTMLEAAEDCILTAPIAVGETDERGADTDPDRGA